jgi:hypothetical protein
MKITEMFDKKMSDIGDLADDDMIYHKPVSNSDKEYVFKLGEDLVFYMNNDDDFYRRHYFPVLKLCKNKHDHNMNFSHRVFKPVIKAAYDQYKQKFPMRELDEQLSEEQCEKIARDVYEQELMNFKDGKYQ